MHTMGRIAEAVLRSMPASVALRLARGRTRISRHLSPDIQTQIDYYYGDFRINIDTRYPVEREMVSGTYEAELTRVLETIITRGDVCIDVGANIGALTLVMSKLAGDNGVVYAFEPGRLTFERLLANIELNGLTNVVPVRLALGEREEVLGWYLDSTNLGNAGLTRGAEYDELVEVTTLDSYIQGQSIERVDFVKVDVEGMEYSVFLGGQGTLEALRPSILFETLQDRRDRRLQEGSDLYARLETLLRRMGYLLFRIEGAGSYRETTLGETSEDTLAVHRTRDLVLERLRL